MSFRGLLGSLIVLLILAGIVAGVIALDRADLLPSTATARDWVIIAYGLLGVLFFLLGIAVMGLILWQIRGVKKAVANLIDESVRPTLTEVHRTAENVRGTSEFIADSAVSPVIRIISVTRGVRRGISSITGIRSRRK